MTEVRRRDPRTAFFGLCTSAGTSMQSAAAILLVGRTLTRGPPTCLRTAPPPRPIRPETPFDTDGHIVFCQHEYHPAYEVLLYRKIGSASSQVELECSSLEKRYQNKWKCLTCSTVNVSVFNNQIKLGCVASAHPSPPSVQAASSANTRPTPTPLINSLEILQPGYRCCGVRNY